jgi:hypothetical protein
MTEPSKTTETTVNHNPAFRQRAHAKKQLEDEYTRLLADLEMAFNTKRIDMGEFTARVFALGADFAHRLRSLPK